MGKSAGCTEASQTELLVWKNWEPFGADEGNYFSVKGGLFFGRFRLDFFEYFAEVRRLDLEPAMNGMECMFSGFCG